MMTTGTTAPSTATLSTLFSEEFTVCEDCFLVAEFGDEAVTDADPAAIGVALTALCPEALSLHAGEQTNEFSHATCDSCGSCMGGPRFALTALRPRVPGDPIQPSDVPLEMLTAYLEAAAWADYPEDVEPGLVFGVEARNVAREACATFLTTVAATAGIDALTPLLDNPSHAGYDLWLTRQGHGAGFWDEDWDHVGLSEAAAYAGELAAKALGGTYLEVTSDESGEVLTFW